MRRIDYDTEQYRDYARGRALNEQQLQAWLAAFADVLPERRPLVGLDIGSGTGRFTPALAAAFGPVTGIEPSDRMREIAETAQAQAQRQAQIQAQVQSPQPELRYLAGSAEQIPVASESADYALMFLSWSHVRDKPRAVQETARVLRPGGRLLLRTQFSDHMPGLWWLEPFTRSEEVHALPFEPLHEVIAMFTTFGWRVVSFSTVLEPSPGTRGEMLERLRLRTFSVFGHFTADEQETGLRALEQLVAKDPDAPAPPEPCAMLTLERR